MKVMMLSEAPLSRSTTVTVFGNSTAHSADLEPAVKIPPVLRSWTGGSIGLLVGDDARKSFTDYGPSTYRDILDAPMFFQDGQIGYKRARRRGGLTRTGEEFRDHLLFNDRAPTSAALAGFSVVPLIDALIGPMPHSPEAPQQPTVFQ